MKPAGHRNLYNADIHTWVYKYHPKSVFYRPDDHRFTAQDIHDFVSILADNGVDTLVMNSSAECAWYPSKTVPTAFKNYRRGDKTYFLGHIIGWEMTTEQIKDYLEHSVHLMNSYLDFSDAGIDWLAETAAACRQRCISPWVSIRMNDMHGATKMPEFSYLNADLFKDPAMRLKGVTYNPSAPENVTWQGFNFEKKEVRDFTMSIICDPVENYDYEGLELDWTRSPLCCEPDPSQATIDMITEWHAEIRRVTERQAEKIGKPYPLGIRYVGSFDQMLRIGLDLRTMAKEGIIDFLEPTNMWQTSWDIPCDEIIDEVGPDVAVYGVIECAPNWLHGYLPNQTKGNYGFSLPVSYRHIPASAPMLRGNAASKLVLGVDGLETYNFFCADTGQWPWEGEDLHADYPAMQKMDDLEFLRGKPKFYTLSSRNGYYSHEIFEATGPFPAMLGPMQRQGCRLPMCAEPDNPNLEFIIQIVVEKKDEMPPIGVYFNGSWPKFDGVEDELFLFPSGAMCHHLPTHIGLNFTFPLSSIKEGWNEIVVMNGAGKDWYSPQIEETINIVSLELGIREKK